MNRPELRAIAAASLAGKQRRLDAPLAYARLWHSPRTSQRDSIRAMLTRDSAVLFAFLLGGNRAGKSDAGSQMDVALGLGSAHPWTRSWLNGNGFPFDLIPAEPGTVWCVSGDSNDSIRYVRPKMARYLGPTAEWKNREGAGEAKAMIETDRGVATWWFKTVDQGRDGFQGDTVRAIGFDEEPLDPAVVDESVMRVVDQHGRIHFRMTPLYGWTKLLADRVRNPNPDTIVRFISGEDNPYLDQHALARSLAATSEHLKDARAHGRITSAEGLVYHFDRARHVVRSFQPPQSWARYLSIDFGTRNPACWLWFAVDPHDDTLHVYREHYIAGLTTGQHWEAVRGFIGADPRLEEAIADPEDLNARMQLAELGLETRAANKDVRGGIDAMSARLAFDVNRRPGMLVHDSCLNFIREIEGYRWPKPSPGSSAGDREQPMKRDDHAMDAARYLCLFLKLHAHEDAIVVGAVGVAPSYWR